MPRLLQTEETKVKNLWRPIAELQDKYVNNLLLHAPELVNLDCNPAGIGMGYFQDGAKGKDRGLFLAAKWSMTNDEWYEVAVTPTHFILMEGPDDPDAS